MLQLSINVQNIRPSGAQQGFAGTDMSWDVLGGVSSVTQHRDTEGPRGVKGLQPEKDIQERKAEGNTQ